MACPVLAALVGVGCGPPRPPASATRIPLAGLCGVTQVSDRCPDFEGDGGGSLSATLSFSTYMFFQLRDCRASVQTVGLAWATEHKLPVVDEESAPGRYWLLVWSEQRNGWFAFRYDYTRLPPRAHAQVDFLDLALRKLNPAMEKDFQETYSMNSLHGKLTEAIRCAAP
ncbi:hypothetical protein WME89_24905 [Sorangium sp. So ce321]|uniref:hypothetical protein n=1 Tax=Sorangium sp. So ce321 TaxID=3133300 RepID=UPI003F62A978